MPTNLFPRCVPWRARYREGVFKLFKDVPHKRQLWAWQFETNPFSLPFSPVVLVDNKDQVVGFNGVMAVQVTDRGEDTQALWSCDFFLAEAWRNKGFGSDIKYELHKKSPTIMAFGISDRASDVLQHLGWVPDTSVRSFRMVRRFGDWRSWAFLTLQFANRFFRKVTLPWRRQSLSIPLSFLVRSSLPQSHRVDALWQKCAGDYDRIVARSYRYLDWRYQQHPLARYGFIHAEKSGELTGMLVVRVHGEHLRIVDYLGPKDDRHLKQSLIDHAIRAWRHVTQISAVTSDSEFANCLFAAGFVEMRGRPRFFRFEAEPSEKQWFIMAGDSDGEFLHAAAEFCDQGRL